MKFLMKDGRFDWEKGMAIFLYCTLCLSIIFVIFKLFTAPVEIDPANPYIRLKSDYILMLTQCVLGLVALQLPPIIEKKWRIDVPSFIMILYMIFLYCAIFLGEVRSFYYTVPHWDTILHTFSGGMLGALGFSFVAILNRTDSVPLNLSPLFVAVFSFCFALSMGVFWEFYEFSFDGLLGLNMQKFALVDGTMLVGRAALSDTMKDLIVDCLGAFIICFIGYVSLKYKKGWVEQWQIKHVHSFHRKGHQDEYKEGHN